MGEELSAVLYVLSAYLGLIALAQVSLFSLAITAVRKEKGLDRQELVEDVRTDMEVFPCSIIVPCYNEEKSIVQTVHSLRQVDYAQKEIIIVDDGSTDQTVSVLDQHFRLYPIRTPIQMRLPAAPIKAVYRSRIIPELVVVSKVNGGRSDAINAGINISSYPYFCCIDADSILDKQALIKTMLPIIRDPDRVIATGGTVRIANGSLVRNGILTEQRLPKKPVLIMQIIEYMRAFLLTRIALSRLNMLLIVSGAFGVFNKAWVIKAGGFATDTIAEDMEMTVRLQRMIKEQQGDQRIVYIADPVCWTEAPSTLRVLRRQRRRWHQGLTEVLWRHRRCCSIPVTDASG